MAVTQISRGKSVAALAVVCACFAVLWPKIFMPMLQVVFDPHSSNEANGDLSLMHPKMRGSPRTESMIKRSKQMYPNIRSSSSQTSKTNTIGAMGYIMPVYTVAITIFFLYTIFKLLFKNKSNEDNDDHLTNTSGFKDKMNMECDKTHSNRTSSGHYIQALATNYLKCKRLPNKDAQELIRNYSKEDVSQAIQILLQDMKNLKQHILELEKYRNQLCQMKENVTCYDRDDQCSEEDEEEKITNNNLSDKDNDEVECDKSDDELNINDQSSESDAEE